MAIKLSVYSADGYLELARATGFAHANATKLRAVSKLHAMVLFFGSFLCAYKEMHKPPLFEKSLAKTFNSPFINKIVN